MNRLMPYGVSNFAKIRRENCYFVDKTAYIEKLEAVQYPVFLRPRRFGKSLFTEILRWYYDINAADRFEELFGDLYIGKNPTEKHNSYFFLALDFSGFSDFSDMSKQEMRLEFSKTIGVDLRGFLESYSSNLNLDSSYPAWFQENFSDNAAAALRTIIELIANKNGKLFIAIDEYDSLTNALALVYNEMDDDDQNLYLDVLKKGGFFRSFFETLKKGTKICIDQVYITGILPVTISDMNSGFNIAKNISFNDRFINMLGITESEFESLMNLVCDDYDIILDRNEIIRICKQYYNGYKFSPEAESVYNPMMTLYFLDEIIMNKRFPKVLLDNNLRVQYNQVAYIFGKDKNKREKIMEEIMDTGEFYLNSSLNIAFDMIDFREGEYISQGLFYLGLLTFADDEDSLCIPNLVTYEMVIGYFERIKNFDLEIDMYGAWGKALKRQGDIAAFIKGFFEAVIQKFPADFFKDVNESFYRGLLFHLLYNSLKTGQYEVVPEYNLPGGTVDIYLRTYPGAKYPLTDLIEVKRVKKSASDKDLESKLKEGIKQMQGYLTGDYKNWRGIVVCFRGNKDYKVEIL